MESTQLTELIQLQREANELLRKQAKKRELERNQDRATFNGQALAVEAVTALLALSLVFAYSQWQNIQERGVAGAIADMTGLSGDMNRQLKEGDEVAGFVVTSGFGLRKHPISGVTRPHEGVDLNTPENVNLYFPFDSGSVECLSDPTGYGTFAIASSPTSNIEILLAHLNRCQSGPAKFGQIIAQTGSTGGSTGPHLHAEQLVDGKPVNPTKGWVVMVLTGNRFQSGDAARTGFSGAFKFVLEREGGYVNHPNDIGGATDRGIIQSTYDSYRDRLRLPRQAVASITNSEVEQIYKQYWDTANCGSYQAPLDTVCLDTVINFGQGGKSFFQNLPDDPTDAALTIVQRRMDYRYQRVRERPDQKIFLVGWLNRDRKLQEFINQNHEK